MTDRPKLAVHWQILIGLVAAVGIGALGSPATALGPINLAEACDFLGTLFLRALKMVVVPLILSSIIVGVASVRGTSSIGRLGTKTVGYYVLTSTLAVVTGLLVVNLLTPGVVDGRPAKELIGLSEDTAEVARQVEGRSSKDLVDVFLRLVPANVVQDAAEGEMLGLIFFAILFGYFITKLTDEYREAQLKFWQSVNEIMLLITDWVMKFAPIGVFGLVCKVVLTTGLAAFRPLAVFFLCVVLALSLHAGVVLPLLLRFGARVSPMRHYRAVAPAILMAFSTASSSATLPLTMDRVENACGVSRRVTSFTLPLGATVNMDGTALYECVAALFIAQAYGIGLGFAQQFSVVVVALLTSIGVAGIPAASLVAITLILTTIGLPIEGIGLILAVDRVLDMCRTAVNVLSDTTAAVVIGRSEGETAILSD